MSYHRNTIANLAGNFCLISLMLVVTPILIRLMGDVQYGLFRVAMVSMVSYTALLDLGLTNAVRRYFADALNQENSQQANNVLGLSYKIYGVLAILAILIIAGLSPWLPGWVNTPLEMITAFRLLLFSAGVYVAGQFLLCPLRSILIAHGRYDFLQVSQVMMRVLLFGGGIGLLWVWQQSLVSIAVSVCTATILTIIATVWMATRVFPAMTIHWQYRDDRLLKAMFCFGGYGLMIALGPVIVYQTQDALISGFLGPKHVTAFAVAAVLMTQIRTVCNAFASPLFPIASKLKAQEDQEGIKQLFIDGTKRCLWIWVALAAPVIVFADVLISAWISPVYASSRLLIWILLVGNLGTALSYCAGHILTAAGSIKWLGYSQVAMSLVAVTCMVIILGLSSWGLAGVAAAISLPVAMRSGIVVPLYACLQLQVKFFSFFKNILAPLAVYLPVGLGICWLVRIMLRPTSLPAVVACLAVTATAVAFVGIWLFLPAEQRQTILHILKLRKGT